MQSMADIREIHGNLFATTCDVLVNTVNCVGVMGAGVALECRYRFPGLFEYYERFCVSAELEPGKLLLFRESKPQILCFPTKKHWKDPARGEYVEAGLAKFAETYVARGISSVAFPHLGCSNGGLVWDDEIRPLMYRYLESLPGLRVEIYSFDPHSSDPLFDDLAARLRGVPRRTNADLIGLRIQQMNSLAEAVECGEVSTMLGLQQSKGVGPASIVKVYEFLQRKKDTPLPEQQLGFDFDRVGGDTQ